MFSKPPRPKPKPGSLPMEDGQHADADLEKLEPELRAKIEAARNAPPPFPVDEDAQRAQPTEKKPQGSFTKLKAARKKVEELGAAVRDDGFDDWVRRYVVEAKKPGEWTQARALYENYIKRAKAYGNNRGERALSKQELATETQWGKMMGSLFTKKRRGKGWFYPLRLRPGADKAGPPV